MEEKDKDLEVGVAEVVDYLRITGQFTSALHAVIERKITVNAARDRGIKVSGNQLQKAADTFRAGHGLNKATDTQQWLESIGVSVEAFEEYLETNLLIDRFKDQLSRKAKKGKYLKAPAMKESIKEIAYQDWLSARLR
jgi:hypothetical protein